MTRRIPVSTFLLVLLACGLMGASYKLVEISQGGTGASTAAGARANLGAANVQIGAYSSMPTPGAAGNVYADDTTNGFLSIDDGSVYQHYGPQWPLHDPTTNTWTESPTPPSSFTSSNGYLTVGNSTSDSYWVWIRKPLTYSAPYTVTACMQGNGIGTGAAIGFGLGLYPSSGTDSISYYVDFNQTLQMVQLTSQTASSLILNTPANYTQQPVWFRIADNGTTRYYYLSYDGVTFAQAYSEADTTFITATSVGIVLYRSGVTVLSWKESPTAITSGPDFP